METFLPLLIILFLVILPLFARRKRAAAVRQFLNRKKQNKESNEMKELAKRLIGEDCIIYTITSESGSIQGVLKEVEDGGLVIEKTTGETEIVNLDFVTRIREYPQQEKRQKEEHRAGLNRKYSVNGNISRFSFVG